MRRPRMLSGRRILLISPQPWDHLRISKHHYAEHLGTANEVLFLSPPMPKLRWGAIERHLTDTTGVCEIRWRPRLPWVLRFHGPNLYSRLIEREIKRLMQWIGEPLDLVWCFDFNTFPDLRAFGARQAIFHPVDPLSSERQARIAETADLVLSVSPEILASVTSLVPQVPAVVIPHGLGSDFLDLARSKTADFQQSRQVGYFGNLDRPIIDVPLLSRLIGSNPEITFNFWGPASPSGELAKALAQLPNVRLHGAVSKNELAKNAAGMDAFLLAYREHGTESDLSNAHKILEYFAAGRVVISSFMSCYVDRPDLLVRTPRGQSHHLPDLFGEVMRDLHRYNAPELVAGRRALASEHAYPVLVDRIDALLSGSGSKLEKMNRL